MTKIGGQFENLIRAEVSIKRINNLFTTQSSLDEGSGRLLRPGSPINIKLDGVRFGYNSENAVLHDLSFSLDPGETLGLLGRTGSGKSTLSRLLFRFYDVERGAIRFDGIDIRDYELAGLRRRISMVTQEVQLLHSSVRDNITLYLDGISDQAAGNCEGLFERTGIGYSR
jgi:ATP-binding cassette subfamily B protein